MRSVDIPHEKINGVIRAFWRRINWEKNKYEEELPGEMPLSLKCSMITALSLLNDLTDQEVDELKDLAERRADLLLKAEGKIEKLNARCDRDDKLIFEMKDEISKNKATINSLRQKLKGGNNE